METRRPPRDASPRRPAPRSRCCSFASMPNETLSEDAAFAIATAWLAPLRGRVRLVVDRDGPVHSIVKSYAWVRVDPPPPQHPWLSQSRDPSGDRASVVRAAMLTWAALASCVGYSGLENADFWKRVFSEYWKDGGASGRRSSAAVTNAIAFFDQPNHAFPRYMVDVGLSDARQSEARKIFGVGDHQALTARVATLFSRIQAQLEPFVHCRLMETSIDVCVVVDTFAMSARMETAYSELASFIQEINTSTRSPRLQIVRFDESNARVAGNLIHKDGFIEFVRTVPVRVGHFALHQPMRDLPVQDRVEWVSGFMQLDDAQANVESLSFSRHAIDDELFDGLFSALPFARSIHSISFDTPSFTRNGTFDERDLPWIAYAMYHPLSSSSSWRYLDVQHVELTAKSADVLYAMARGNNLLELLQGLPPQNEVYISATLKASTMVRLRPNHESDLLVNVSRDTRVDVCGVASTDISSWSEWVAAVIPAYGLGWILSTQIGSAVAEAPSQSKLSGLRLLGRRAHQNDSCRTLSSALEYLQDSLTYLDIGAYTKIDAAGFQQIVQACPSLKTLIASRRGRGWRETIQSGTECALNELELIVDRDENFDTSSTHDSTRCQLRALRLSVGESDVLSETNRAYLQKLLAPTSSLRFFHWQDASRSVKTSVSFETSQQWTRELLSELGLPKIAAHQAQGSFNSDSAIAFLSVVQSSQPATGCDEATSNRSALGQLTDRGVLATIFQFATSPVRRTVCLEPSIKQVPIVSEPTWFERLRTDFVLFIAGASA